MKDRNSLTQSTCYFLIVEMTSSGVDQRSGANVRLAFFRVMWSWGGGGGGRGMVDWR
jgi:hypothetical protein